MRGIATEWKRKHVLVDQEIEDIADDEEEGRAADREQVTEIFKALDDDPVALKILSSMLIGARGDELLKISGLSQTEYESKRRKIRRRVEKIWMESKK
jgi:hypothetical protein